MSWNENQSIRVAILDLYEGVENQGMRCLREILNQFADFHHLNLHKDEFDVRLQNEVPGLDYDIYISSGGPGSPLESEGNKWEKVYFNWLEDVQAYNRNDAHVIKKQVFFICHSFQLACRQLGLGNVTPRKSTAFGVFPVHYLPGAETEPVFAGLKDPFYAVDSRDFQVIQPDHNKIKEMGGQILAIEKARPHVPYERAMMALRFNENMIGTQFHPEADAIGMSLHLQSPEKKKTVVDNYGFEKWQNMIGNLNDPDKIMHTYAHILPNFLNESIAKMQPVEI
ncbi:MAG: GMP synthase [Niastella sp. SCN 39-18]|nr:GMP synthase [Sphingobacteriales bacterium]ODT52045.1 MAG: GMP synthase [Niastella sp. SCN 39-18]OJW11005.1 MAG: GMP synthase [Sphingobacteriales bacterium 39-19]